MAAAHGIFKSKEDLFSVYLDIVTNNLHLKESQFDALQQNAHIIQNKVNEINKLKKNKLIATLSFIQSLDSLDLYSTLTVTEANNLAQIVSTSISKALYNISPETLEGMTNAMLDEMHATKNAGKPRGASGPAAPGRPS